MGISMFQGNILCLKKGTTLRKQYLPLLREDITSYFLYHPKVRWTAAASHLTFVLSRAPIKAGRQESQVHTVLVAAPALGRLCSL